MVPFVLVYTVDIRRAVSSSRAKHNVRRSGRSERDGRSMRFDLISIFPDYFAPLTLSHHRDRQASSRLKPMTCAAPALHHARRRRFPYGGGAGAASCAQAGIGTCAYAIRCALTR